MTHPDPDPLDVTPEDTRQREIDGYLDRYYATGIWDWERPDADFADRLTRFREQRRRSRWGCSVALLALTLACLVFWAAVLFVAVNVFAAPSAAPDPVRHPGASEQGQRGAPHAITAADVTTAGTSLGGAPLPAAASQPASPDVSVPAPLATLTYTGVVNYAEPSLGRFYLAIPNGPGWRVRICGPAGCLDRTSTDAGPDLAMQRAGRIADLNSVDWQQISGVSLRYGGFQGTVLVLGRPRARLPETDMEGP